MENGFHSVVKNITRFWSKFTERHMGSERKVKNIKVAKNEIEESWVRQNIRYVVSVVIYIFLNAPIAASENSRIKPLNLQLRSLFRLSSFNDAQLLTFRYIIISYKQIFMLTWLLL